MVTSRQYKELKAVEMLYSTLSYGGSSWLKYLIDSSGNISSNFDTSATLTGIVPPTTTSGLVENANFIYRTPFEKKTRIEGPVYGNFCLYLENNVTSSYKTVFTRASIGLSALKANGSSRVLIADTDIFPVASGVPNIELVGIGALQTVNYGLYWTTTIDCNVAPTELLVLNLKTYGYKTSTSTTHKMYTRIGKSDGDLKIALPLVG